MDWSRAWRLGLTPAVIGVLAVAGAGCGDEGGGGGGGGQEPRTDPADARFDLKIGDLIPLSGDLAPFGPAGRKASNLAVEEAREALREAKVRGVDVDVNHADTETNPQSAVPAARRLVSDGATCLTGGWASASTIPVAQSVTTPERIPLISPASTSAQLTTLEDEGLVFRTTPSNKLQGDTLADVVEKELGGVDQTLAIAARNDAYGQTLAQTFRRAWEAKGGRLTGGPVLYDPNQPDLAAEADRIVADDPGAFVIVDFPESYARLGRELLKSGKFDASKLFVTDGLAGEKLSQVPNQALEGARGTRPGTPVEGKAPEAFNRLYGRSDEKPDDRQIFDAQNFDATMLCFLAAVAAGSNQGEAIQSKIRDVSAPPGRPVTFEQLDEAVKLLRRGEDIDYQGASGPIDLDAQGDPTAGTFAVFEYGKGADFRLLRQIQVEQGQGVTETESRGIGEATRGEGGGKGKGKGKRRGGRGGRGGGGD